MKITVRHNQTEIIADLPRGSDGYYYHPVGCSYSDKEGTVEKSLVLQRLLKLIEVMADSVVHMDRGISRTEDPHK